ncbi:MAG: hypothetical protein ACXVGF_04785 [Blastococcus sp.]
MPLIRYTYEPDIRRFGDQPVHVEDVEARTRVDDMRRAVRVAGDELEQMRKDHLAEIAEKVGADVPKNAAKAKIAEKIAEAEGQ